MRFPALDHVVPDPAAVATRLRLDPEDARFLGAALDRLPGSAEEHAPATLELNGKVALRAQGADHAPPTELVLARSAYTGSPVRLNTNREFLGRALRLGFSEIGIVDADSPILCCDRGLIYCWQPLAKGSAIEPTDDVTRITSSMSVTPTSVPDDVTAELRPIMSRSHETSSHNDPEQPTARITSETERQDPAGLPALIQEMEALHRTLTDARSRAGRLVVALRRHRRRERLVNSTLASLRALRLQDVAG